VQTPGLSGVTLSPECRTATNQYRIRALFYCAIITLSLLPGGSDAQILVRDLDDVLVERLKRQAKRNHRSLQGEVKAILIESARMTPEEMLSAAENWQRRLAGGSSATAPASSGGTAVGEDRFRGGRQCRREMVCAGDPLRVALRLLRKGFALQAPELIQAEFGTFSGRSAGRVSSMEHPRGKYWITSKGRRWLCNHTGPS